VLLPRICESVNRANTKAISCTSSESDTDEPRITEVNDDGKRC
jgi:hypothetical protein